MKIRFLIKNSLLILLIFFSIITKGQGNNGGIVYHKSLLNFDYKRPLFELEDEQLTNEKRMLRYIALTGYREGVQPIKGLANFASYKDEKNGTFRIYMYNLSIQDMLTHGFYKSNRVILEVMDPSKYHYIGSEGTEEEWLRHNGHCFEMLMPIGAMTNGAKVLDQELGNVFKVKFGIQKRMVNALVLTRTSNIDKIKTKGKGDSNYDGKGHFNNLPIDRLNNPLNAALMPPLVNETGYKANIDLDLNVTSWKDLDILRKELQKYDLDIKEEKREVDMFVISEILANQ